MRTHSRSRCLAVLLNRRHYGRIVLAVSLVLTACQSRPSAAPHAHPGPLPADPALTATGTNGRDDAASRPDSRVGPRPVPQAADEANVGPQSGPDNANPVALHFPTGPF